MQTKFIEAVSDAGNHGKFLVGRFTPEEWDRRSTVDDALVLRRRGWTADNVLVTDLQTGEGAIFRPCGYAKADLDKHAIWVCPLFEPFLTWLYTQDLTDLEDLPALVELTGVPLELAGYRRTGPAGR